ncbi:MAG: two component, sigma54 specific, transcriptional regulator, Fis family [uncultured Gemmatimonadetes bacterium]|uniref:Two component, sigma54 specific, transcriptional regulator, Fis family n=1 Tax=uncultured Gemmatimonadota bacterium TaxID=203437 RepID=A0A6J4KIX5_9BACT|nr:MAG: two component, sigma54 specific, transcriptional regulator, Fis family [uncultured Gemmatimonadota bacterium]
MSDSTKILVIDDETAILDTLRILLRREGFQVETAVGGQQGVARMEELRPDVVLSDVRMPGVGGLEVLLAAKELDPSLPVILMTAQASLQTAIRAVNEGAFYYIQKPFANDEMVAICRRAAESRQLKRENQALKTEIRRRDRGDAARPIGRSRRFLDVLRTAETVAPTDSTLLVTGESGTGKEVLAKYVHEVSGRTDGPFVSINCGALPESLLESELFGHTKGSFTGAHRDKQGLFEAAKGGTFFMDEVGEMSPATQVKLLRVLQEREVIPVGATEAVPVDVRIVAATNRDLEEEIRRGGFRSDLYYRLNVITLHLPPLRDRSEDVPLLAAYFLERFAAGRGRAAPALSQEAVDALAAYDWPGNVRELENALERAAVLTAEGEIQVATLPARITERAPQPLVAATLPPNPTLEIVERAYIHWVLQSESGNKTRAAEVLGIDPSTLYRKLLRYGMESG